MLLIWARPLFFWSSEWHVKMVILCHGNVKDAFVLPLTSALVTLCSSPIGVLSFNDEDKYCRVVDLNAIPFNLPSRTTTQQINRKHPFSKNEESCWWCCWCFCYCDLGWMDGWPSLLERRSFKYIFVKYCFVLCMSCCHVRRQEEQNINRHVSTKAISSASLSSSSSSDFLFNYIFPREWGRSTHGAKLEQRLLLIECTALLTVFLDRHKLEEPCSGP